MKSFLLSSLIFIATLKAQGPQQPVPAVYNPPITPPINPGPPAQIAPATPHYGPPQQPAPYNPYAPRQQFNPYGGFMPQMDPQNLNCEMGQCRNRRIVLSPGQGFNLNCQQPFQCDGLDLTLNVGHDPTNWGSGVGEISDLKFDAPTNGATIKINSVGGNNIEVNNLRCSVMGACRNLKIIAGWGVEAHNINVHCDQPGACTGCTINGQSCAMISMMSGNNNGYMQYGYGPYGGYTNTPNAPQPYPQQPQGPPQYPGVQQPQQPQLPQYPQGPAMPQQGGPQYPAWI